MKINTEILENQTLLLMMPSAEYNDTIISVIKELKDKKICYVTLNKTSDALKELFEKNNIDISNLVFIDAISKTLKKVPDVTETAYFVSSPGALTELSLALTKFLEHGFDYVIFDSIDNLFTYQKEAQILKFLLAVTDKIKKSKTKTIFYALSTKDPSEAIKKICTVVDKVEDLNKTNNSEER